MGLKVLGILEAWEWGRSRHTPPYPQKQAFWGVCGYVEYGRKSWKSLGFPKYAKIKKDELNRYPLPGGVRHLEGGTQSHKILPILTFLTIGRAGGYAGMAGMRVFLFFLKQKQYPTRPILPIVRE